GGVGGAGSPGGIPGGTDHADDRKVPTSPSSRGRDKEIGSRMNSRNNPFTSAISPVEKVAQEAREPSPEQVVEILNFADQRADAADFQSASVFAWAGLEAT